MADIKKGKLYFRKNLLEHLICTILPFLIPFVLEVSDEIMSRHAKEVIACIVGALYIVLSSYIYIRGKRESHISYTQKSSRYAFFNAYVLMEKKRDYLIEKTYNNSEYYIPDEMIPYNVHQYIGAICKKFENVISEITGINKEYMSVSFIYRYCYDEADEKEKKWKWIVGRELTNIGDLNEFVEAEDTLFHYLVYGKDGAVFVNKKEELIDGINSNNNHYRFSRRDTMHKNVGSIFGVRIMFSNNAKKYVDSLLTISTYGKNFTESEKANDLRNLIFDELLPYYQRCLEMELGYLYLRHSKEKEE